MRLLRGYGLPVMGDGGWVMGDGLRVTEDGDKNTLFCKKNPAKLANVGFFS